jgi:hypothetical protein
LAFFLPAANHKNLPTLQFCAMIEPELISDLHKAFKYFCKVTNPHHFLKERQIRPLGWQEIILYALLPATIWIVYFFLPLLVAHFLAFANNIITVWSVYTFIGGFLWIIMFLLPARWLRSRRFKKALHKKGISIKRGYWFGKKVELLMMQEFTSYLARKGLYNKDAVEQLAKNTRDEIESRWRPTAIILALFTVDLAIAIAYYQTVFGRVLATPSPLSGEDLALLIRLGVVLLTVVLLYNCLFLAIYYSYFGKQRATYLHCLSNISLSLLKDCKKGKGEPKIASPPAEIPKPAFFLLFCEFRNPFRKGKTVQYR